MQTMSMPSGIRSALRGKHLSVQSREVRVERLRRGSKSSGSAARQRSGCSFGGRLSHFGPPTEPKNRIGSVANRLGAFRESLAVVVDSNPANVSALVFKGKAEPLTGGLENVECDIHDFRANPVSGEYCKL